MTREEVILFHMVIKILRGVLPMKEFNFLEEESKKLLKFKHIYTFDYRTDEEIPKQGECLSDYIYYRPIVKVTDTVLIDLICKKYSEDWLFDISLVCDKIQSGILYIGPCWEFDITEKERKRQEEDPEFNGYYTIYEE